MARGENGVGVVVVVVVVVVVEVVGVEVVGVVGVGGGNNDTGNEGLRRGGWSGLKWSGVGWGAGWGHGTPSFVTLEVGLRAPNVSQEAVAVTKRHGHHEAHSKKVHLTNKPASPLPLVQKMLS